MQKDKLLVLGVFVLIVGAAVGLQSLRGRSDGAPGPPARSMDAGKLCGISLQLHNPHPDHPYLTYIDEIAETGANTICLTVTGYQENCSSSSIFIEARKTPSAARVAELVRHAHSRGLRVVMMPVVLLENPRSGEWRGKINPDDWDAWWEDYSNFVLHYAAIAAAEDVEVFAVGSELISTEKQTDRWRTLIANTREAYDGLLTYSSNWDHYKVPKFWDDLDLVGMTAYYDLTGGDEPTIERLMKSWRKIKTDVLEWQATVNRPILFTEVGWPNQSTCAAQPWNYYAAQDDPDPQAQANCFESFFRTWHDEPAVAGILVWEWRNYPGMTGGPDDPGYFPRGNPAMDVIEKYFARMQQADAQAPTAETRPAGADDTTALIRR